jgi:plasmid maintenance system antidote protein VapI
MSNENKKSKLDLTEKEIAESMLIPNTDPITAKEKEEFLKKRLEIMKSQTMDDLLRSNLLQFKYEVETYLELGEFNPSYSFSNCLKRYMQITAKSSKDLTEELTVHKTKLSRIINDREEANASLTYKLETHSSKLFPAIFWWKLITLKKEHEIKTNKTDRKKAAEKVKSMVRLRKMVYG